MKSSRGCTALHLSVLDSPQSTCIEISFLLLCMSIDTEIKCSENFTAYELAQKNNKKEIIEIFHKFKTNDKNIIDEISPNNVQTLYNKMK